MDNEKKRSSEETVNYGLVYENGELYYYREGFPYHAGVVEINGDIYYIGTGGKAVKGVHVVHRSMSNGILKRGTYKFDDDYKLVKDFYIPPKEIKHEKREDRSKKSPKKNKKDNKVNFFSPVLLISISLILLIVILIIYYIEFRPGHISEKDNASSQNINLFVDEFSKDSILSTKEAKDFFDGNLNIESIVGKDSPYRPFVFRYTIKNGIDGELLLSENRLLSSEKKYILPCDNNFIEIHNLKVGTEYNYVAKCGSESVNGSFWTASSPRFVFIDGAENTRDIGNRKTINHKTIKQGLIIRGTEIDGIVKKDHMLREDENSIKETFGFVYDFDLRDKSTVTENQYVKYVSPLGEDVDHKFYEAPKYTDVFNEDFKNNIKDIFSSFADKNKYPMYIHDTEGCDRTGTIIFLLQGLLGVSEEDMVREYRLSSFYSDYYVKNEEIHDLIKGLNEYEGENINEKICNFLKNDIGVTEDEIWMIKNILLED